MHFPSIETAFPKRHVKKRPIFHHVYIIKKLFERQQIIQEDTFPLSKLCHGLLLTLDYHVVWIRQWENDVLILFLLSKFHAGEVSEKMVWPSSDRNVELPSGRPTCRFIFWKMHVSCWRRSGGIRRQKHTGAHSKNPSLSPWGRFPIN